MKIFKKIALFLILPMVAMAFASSNGDEVGECPAVDGEYVTLLPSKSDCNAFYQCNEGAPILKRCNAGLHFNPNLLVCDYPEQAGCNLTVKICVCIGSTGVCGCTPYPSTGHAVTAEVEL